MNIRTVVSADGGLEIFCQPSPVGLPQPMAYPVTDQGMQAGVKENGKNREFDTGAPGSGGNDVAVDRVLVLFGQIVQEELFDFRSGDQFRLDFVCWLVGWLID